MNAVEIEAAVSDLALQPFDAAEFPFAFLAAFGNKETTIKRLRKGGTNTSDLPGGVLQHRYIHISTCEPGRVGETLMALRNSPRTAVGKVKFILATDGETLEAEELTTGETIAPKYADFPSHFGFFLPLAGISTIKEIKDNPIDVRATGRLNKLYIELLKDNPEWATEARRHDMNHFMARLIFCFFAEDTDIFFAPSLFTKTVEQMSTRDSANTHEVIGRMFRAMNTKIANRAASKLPGWADAFPYVNGELFSGSTDVPRFSKMARTYLLHAGALNWREINPDIFGSMIQAVAEDEERGKLGMHYTSVPNILKVLNPLFLDDLRSELKAAGDNPRMLLNLRKRMAKIRVFDPACGSGNFLVIAYKQMRAIEFEINQRRGEPSLHTEIPLTNFRGIELRDFPAEIARLALVIAQYQCDVLYRGQIIARAEFLPLDAMNWITCGNALRLDWLSICPPSGNNVKLMADDLFSTPLDQVEIDFENEGGETYVCGNPPYKGATEQNESQKADLGSLLLSRIDSWKSLDYVSGWFVKYANYHKAVKGSCAFVSTNSITQGEQVARLWPLVLSGELRITFAYTSFKWSNIAAQNAGVTVVIIGLGPRSSKPAILIEANAANANERRAVPNINAYLVAYKDVFVEPRLKPPAVLREMINGNKPADGGHLILSASDADAMKRNDPRTAAYIKVFIGSAEAINGYLRYCLWIDAEAAKDAMDIPQIRERVHRVAEFRAKSKKLLTKAGSAIPYAFQQVRQRGDETLIIIPRVSSEMRPYLPVILQPKGAIIGDRNFALYDAPLWNIALIASRVHWVWVGTVCVRLRTDFSYSNTLGWNTFPVPPLTEENKADLTRCAENILLAREAHFPATIADLYEPNKMPEDLRRVHEQSDEVLERIYIGRRFRNDTERLEKLFELYTKMTSPKPARTEKRRTVA